ncbi:MULTISPECIES: serine racemase VanT catalytic subunit [Brevibacillus]|uniref:serine racemase VanT catalytic subunit n=1 Tax=Brevibacillus TaxID=55080 RepID=UPI000D0E9F2B|nr:MULTISPECIES: serine racemase VanT catalytic subunit [Brevibacillus]MED1945441.1 serine racemase VanT catalytic subunit [Brevibacillus formosus]MED1998436.1 serine racemase VanT catalytic subunit [Brevibacillus formosus]MED2080997.1 serine racemase VanT catalytic subunit [Brevibacillus formosus]PSK16242.1 serine racemase VanT catalytic subunit [Brevibacillus sp. NRRL NRS-603]
MNAGSEKQYGGLDRFRIMAAILVIAIHTSPLLSINEWADFTLTRTIARVAVPFFFLCTGFFFLQKLGTDRSRNAFRLKQFLWKVGKLYLLSILLYLPVNVYTGNFTDGFTVFSAVKDLLFNGTLYHLWYFPGIMLGVCISTFLYTRLSMWNTFWVTLLLYGIGLLGDSYYGLAQMSPYADSIYQLMFTLFDYTRNGIFFAPVFIVMGGMIANTRRRKKKKITPYAIGFVLFGSMLVMEGLLLHAYQLQRHDSMYIFLIPCMYFLFQLLLFWKVKNRPALRKLSLYVYVIHPLGIVLIRGAAKVTGLTGLLVENSLVHFTLVTVLSFVLSVIVMKVIQHFRGGKLDQTGRAWADIHLPHLQHNVREIQRVLPKDCGMMAVVKAQAYGHGGWQIACFLNKLGIDHFAVATIDEGIELRKKGVKGEILVLGYTDERRIRQIARFKLTQTVVDDEYAKKLNGYNVKIAVHIKIDTGMGRLGESWERTEKIADMYQYKNLQVCGTFTHLSVADSLEALDIEYTKNQIARFQKVIEQLKEKGIDPQKLHVQSSYGVLNYGELQYDYARIGIALYGMLSKQGDKVKTSVDLRPVLSLKARVVQVKQVETGASVGYGRAYTAQKDSKIAIVSIGYADGVPRMLSQSGATCLIKGKRRPIIGFVCMDQLIVDITDMEGVQKGDVVTFIGRDQEEGITPEEMAHQCKTITNELVCRLGERVKRVYHD